MSTSDRAAATPLLKLMWWVWAAAAPIAFHGGMILLGLAVVRAIRSATAAPPAILGCAAVIPVLAEWAFTRAYEVRRRAPSLRVRAGLIARMIFAALVGYLFVVVPIQSKNTWDNWFVQDLAESMRFLDIVWSFSWLPSTVLATLCAAAYVHWTVRRAQARLTTTVGLPAAATVVLFILLYYYPAAPLVRPYGLRPDFVEHVWKPTTKDHTVPRELMVSSDERYAVATFGSTFPLDASDPPESNLALGRRCDPTFRDTAECRRNIALIDLANGTTRTWTSTIARRFQNEGSDRVFVAPYRVHHLVEVRLDGFATTYPLPETIDGLPFSEVNDTYYAPDLHRVFMSNGNNPLIVSWDVDAKKIDKVLQLAGWNGLAIGDVPLSIARSRSRGRLYVTVKADQSQVVEIDEKTLRPLRSFQPVGYDVEVSPDERSLYVSSFLSGDIWRFDADTLARTATIDAPVQCRRVGFSPDGSLMFAAAYFTGELVTYDTTDNRRLDSFHISPRLEGMHVTQKGLYLLSAEGMFRVPLEILRQRADAARQ